MIVETAALTEFFEEAVHESLSACRVEATVEATTYLVTMLEDFAKPHAHMLDRPVSILYAEALRTPNRGERFERLRALGDSVLYSAGFFGDHFERRGVDAKFVCALGARAYGSLSEMLSARSHDVFGELARKFEAFVLVLSDVADQSTASSKDILRLYERWLKTGSERIAGALGERGVVPARVIKGIH